MPMRPVATLIARLALTGATLALLSACGGSVPAAPPAPTPASTPEQRLVAAIEAAGCVLTADNRDAVLLAANVTTDETAAIITAMNAQGRAEAADAGSIRILSDRCI